MTQPQDKMRAEFEAFAIGENWIVHRDSFGDYMYGTARDGWISWQAACAQQSAQSQQDALDAARWRKARTILTMTDIEEAEFHSLAGIPEERESLRADEVIDAAIATQGASNV